MTVEDHKLTYKLDGQAIRVRVCRNDIYISVEDFQRYMNVKDSDQFRDELISGETDFAPYIDEYIQFENYLLEFSLDHFEKD
jgi:hypothetical protein